MLNIAKALPLTLLTLYLELLFPPPLISNFTISWCTESSLNPTILSSLASKITPFKTSERQLAQILSKSFSNLLPAEDGPTIRLLFQSWHDRTGLHVTKSQLMMDCSSSRTVSSFPLRFVPISYISSTPLTVALSLHFVMLAAVCSGQALIATSPTCASPAVFVPSMHASIHGSHSNHTQYQLYHGN